MWEHQSGDEVQGYDQLWNLPPDETQPNECYPEFSF